MNNDNSLYDQQRRAFGVGTLRLFGGLQIGLGILVCILSIVGIVLDGVDENKDCEDPPWTDEDCTNYWDAPTLLGLDIPCLILSGWFIIVGCLPFCISNVRMNSWRCLVGVLSWTLKYLFMVCNIVGASIIIPAVLNLGVVGSIIRSGDSSVGLATLPALVAFASFFEMVLAIVAASFCCCCSSFGKQKNTPGLVFVTTDQHGNIVPMPQSQIPQQYLRPGSGQLSGGQNIASAPLMGPTYQTGLQQQPGPTYNNYSTFTASDGQPPPYKSL